MDNICGTCQYRRKCNRHSICNIHPNKVVYYFDTCKKYSKINKKNNILKEIIK